MSEEEYLDIEDIELKKIMESIEVEGITTPRKFIGYLASMEKEWEIERKQKKEEMIERLSQLDCETLTELYTVEDYRIRLGLIHFEDANRGVIKEVMEKKGCKIKLLSTIELKYIPKELKEMKEIEKKINEVLEEKKVITSKEVKEIVERVTGKEVKFSLLRRMLSTMSSEEGNLIRYTPPKEEWITKEIEGHIIKIPKYVLYFKRKNI